MKTNVSPLDAAIRSGLGLSLVASPLVGFHSYPYNFLGLVLIASGVIGFCPIYAAVRGLFAPRPHHAARSHG